MLINKAYVKCARCGSDPSDSCVYVADKRIDVRETEWATVGYKI